MLALNKYIEYLWLVGAIATALFAGYKITFEGWEENYFLLIFPAICGAWYGARRFMRKRMERILEEQKQQGNRG